MKYFIVAILFLISAGDLSAQNKAPAKKARTAAKSASDKAAISTPGLKITKISGTVNLMKDGLVVMTLKPGDSIPALVDPGMTFNVIDGSFEIETGGKTITAAAGANFTVTATQGQVDIALDNGAPVEVRTASGSSIVLAQNSEVKLVDAGGNVEVSVVKGSAMMADASGGGGKTVQAGESARILASGTSVVTAAAKSPEAGQEPAGKEEPVVTPTVIPETSVVYSQTVEESCEFSGSTPACN